jgi:hypothetical protein
MLGIDALEEGATLDVLCLALAGATVEGAAAGEASGALTLSCILRESSLEEVLSIWES